jgi:hypothetical protein
MQAFNKSDAGRLRGVAIAPDSGSAIVGRRTIRFARPKQFAKSASHDHHAARILFRPPQRLAIIEIALSHHG